MRKILTSLIAVSVAALGMVALTAGAAPAATNKPGSPRAVRGTPGNTQAVVSWSKPLSNGGAAIDAYEVITYLHESPRPVNVFHSTKTSQTIFSLTNGKSYTFRVAAHNVAGWGRLSAESDAVAIGVPVQPTNVLLSGGSGQARVSWKAPALNNGSSISSYRVTGHTGVSTLSARTFNSTATTQIITGLTNGKAYSFHVEAHNARGWGPPSPESAEVTVGAPWAPTHVAAVKGHARATVSWTAPARNNGSAIAAYRVTPYVGSAAKPAQTFNSTATSHVITGLTSGQAYRFRVEAHNARGWSPRSAPSAVVTPT